MSTHESKPSRRSLVAGAMTLAACAAAPDAPAPGMPPAAPQGRDTAPDPQRIVDYAETLGFTLGTPTDATVTPDGTAVLYLRAGPRARSQALYELDLATGDERLVADAAALLGETGETVSDAEQQRRERERIRVGGIVSYQLSADGAHVLVPLAGRLFVLERATGTARALDVPAPAVAPQLSPDGARVAWVHDGDVHVAALAGGTARRLTRRAPDGAVHHGLPEFVAHEELSRERGLWWSPGGDRLVVQRTDEREVPELALADPLHPETPPRVRRYPLAGRANADVRLGIVTATGGDTVWIDWDRDALPYVVDVLWDEAGPLTVLVSNRRQTEYQVLRVDPDTGATTRLLRERDAAWIDPPHRGVLLAWVPDGSGFLWVSERTGAPALELRAPDGTLVRELLARDTGLRKLIGVDPGGQGAYVTAAADPAEAHALWVPLSGAAPVPLSREPGVHVARPAGAAGWFQLRSATLAGELVVEVGQIPGPTAGPDASPAGRQGATGRVRLPSRAEPLAAIPRVELTEVPIADAPHPIAAAIVRPRDFDPDRRYPVLLSVYGGPGVQVVSASAHKYVLDQWYADHGFIVVRMDARGTPGRDRAWARATAGDLVGTPLDDQVRALAALAAHYPALDTDRVGIYGWSFGGTFAAMAALQRPEVFDAAIAGAPVTDWRLYDTAYTERYLGLPGEAPAAYERSSPLTYADRLAVPLLLVHGTVDDNVYFANSLALSRALFRAGKDHELLALPGFTHMVPEATVQVRLHQRMMRFFAEHVRDAR